MPTCGAASPTPPENQMYQQSFKKIVNLPSLYNTDFIDLQQEKNM